MIHGGRKLCYLPFGPSGEFGKLRIYLCKKHLLQIPDVIIIYLFPQDIVLVTEVRLTSKSDTLVLELAWNPGITNILAACLSDGSMVAYELKSSGVDISTLPPAAQAK